MTLGAVASSIRRSAGAPANVILNGTFASNTIWTGAGFNGKTISGGKANFAATTAFDGFAQSGLTLVNGMYYELTYTISGYSAGTLRPYIGNTSAVSATDRTANGTYVQRLLNASGSNTVCGFQLAVAGTMSVDDLSLVGPYTTSTVGGA